MHQSSASKFCIMFIAIMIIVTLSHVFYGQKLLSNYKHSIINYHYQTIIIECMHACVCLCVFTCVCIGAGMWVGVHAYVSDPDHKYLFIAAYHSV